MVRQYPHLAVIKNSGLDLDVQGRFELSTNSRIVLFNNEDVLVKGIFYAPLPINDVQEKWSCQIYNQLVTSGYPYYDSKRITFRNSVTAQAGVRILPANVSSAIIPDWQGWNISINRAIYEMVPGFHYTWNPNTATLTLLQPGDIFQPNEYFLISFEPKIDNQTIQGQSIITEYGKFMYSGVVKQFSRGQLNARLWL